MLHTILDRFTNDIIVEVEAPSFKKAVERAVISGANLTRAVLTGADLTRANLSRADLSRAVLTGANLYGANFKDTIYENKAFQSFQYQRHYAQMQGDEIIIGCERHSIDYWKKNYKKIGLYQDYTDEQIDAYGKWIMSL